MDNPWAVFLLSMLIGGYPLFPALFTGEIPGVGHTDLIPAVWSIWAFAQEFPSLGYTRLLNHPEGMGWYPQSLHTALMALPLHAFLPLGLTYTLCLWIARSLTFGFIYKAARAWNMSISGALFAMLAIGLSPILYGYAYEGIVEGVHLWPLALWLWMLARRSSIGIAIGFFLSITASWYLAAVACLLLVFVRRQEKALYSLAGLVLALPFVGVFFSAFPDQSPIDFSIRQAHAIAFDLPTPFWLQDTAPSFGQSAYVSATLLALLALNGRWKSLYLLIPVGLGCALPLVSELPVLSSIRFPYRWQLATTVLAILLLRQRLIKPIHPSLLLLVAAELIGLSPFPPILPSTALKQSDLFAHIDGPVLNLPNVLHRPPGQFNPSKMRAVSIYSAQFQHQQPIMASPGFNALSHVENQIPDSFLALDPYSDIQTEAIHPTDIQRIEELGVRYILIHTKAWPREKSRMIQNQLENINHHPLYSTESHILYAIGDKP